MSIVPFSSRFKASPINVGSAEQYVRTGGSGPAVLLLHGFGDTGDMWQPLAEVLVADHKVIVPDLRGMGLSTHPEGGYEKASQARDLAAILDRAGGRPGDAGDARHRQHGGLRVGGAVSAARDEVDRHGRAAPGTGDLGEAAAESRWSGTSTFAGLM